MYVYENKAHEVCIVLDGVIPQETPDFVIKFDAEARKLYVNDTAIDSALSVEEDETESAEEDETGSVEDLIPNIEDPVAGPEVEEEGEL